MIAPASTENDPAFEKVKSVNNLTIEPLELLTHQLMDPESVPET